MTDSQAAIQKLRAVAENVTPAPWRVSDSDNGAAEADPDGLRLADRYPLWSQDPEIVVWAIQARNTWEALLDCVGAATEYRHWMVRDHADDPDCYIYEAAAGETLDAALARLTEVVGA